MFLSRLKEINGANLPYQLSWQIQNFVFNDLSDSFNAKQLKQMQMMRRRDAQCNLTELCE